jgi:hypothetical protein
VVTGSKDFYQDGHDYVGCTLRVRWASLADVGRIPQGRRRRKMAHLCKMSKDPDYNYMDDSDYMVDNLVDNNYMPSARHPD